jgi:hypothetical protein
MRGSCRSPPSPRPRAAPGHTPPARRSRRPTRRSGRPRPAVLGRSRCTGADAHEGHSQRNRGTFSVTATANRSFGGKFVLVERLAASGVVQLKKVVRGSASSATFTIRVQPGNSRLRAVMPTSQTQPGYSAAQSVVLVIHSSQSRRLRAERGAGRGGPLQFRSNADASSVEVSKPRVSAESEF